jgi:S1-C subfamily serine protease
LGVIIDRGRGLILTNAHVVAPAAVGQAVATWRFSDEAESNPSKIQVDVSPGVDRAAEPRFTAKVVAVDGYLDIAVIKISQTMSGAEIDASDLSGLTEVSLGNSDTAHSGDAITAIGYPGAADSTAPTLTRGVISGIIGDPRLHTNRAKLNLDATISPGNSGGSASDSHGRLIGVTTWGLRDDKGQTVLSSMRPINLTKPVITAAQQGKTYTSPWTKAGPEGAEVSDLSFATAGEDGTIETGCQDSSSSSGPLAISFAYKGFPGGEHTDVLAALYKADVTNPGPDDQLAIATTTLDSSYPTQLPTSGCATMTFAPLSGRLASGKYLLKIGVGGDLRVVETGTVTL